jgi:predicted NAD/FAD-dependent oxidoreductase
MDSICRGLLDHENIEVVLRTRADARFESSGSSSSSRRRWNLFSTNTNGSSSEELSLGSFDWLVSSDRLSIGDHRRDLPKDVLKTFYGKTQAVQSIKCLVAMVVFESSLDIPYDGVRFIGHDGTTTSTARYGSLGWVCRDTSKPGRQQRRDGDCVDGHECWVLQSHPTAAEQILNSMSPDSTIDDIRQRAKDVLMEDFMNAIPSLATTTTTGNIPVPRMIESIGHRWGAAFPLVVVDDDDRSTLLDEEFYIDTSTNFVSCGDYYGGGRKLTGRIEGAYLSGMSAASQLIEYLETKKKS